MKQPTLIDGITVAVLISLAAGASVVLFGGFILYGLLFEILLYGAALAYLLYLMKRSQARVGRVIVIASWATISLVCWFFEVALLEQVLIQAGLIWLVRSLYFHSTLISAGLDFGLVSVGLAAAAWAFSNTGSAVAALWSFFLLQALFCWLPNLTDAPTTQRAAAKPSRFQSAHRVAVDAARKLSQP